MIKYKNEILFVQHTYTSSMTWTFPGGGVKQNESPEEAAKREIFEEIGLKLVELKKIGELKSEREYKKDTIYCFVAIPDSKEYHVDKSEILNVGWFREDEFPWPISYVASEMLEMEGIY